MNFLTPRAILFDLDDTLLINNMDSFLPHYLTLLSTYAADYYDPRLLIQHLLVATQAMAKNTDPRVTNEEAFWAEFSRLTGLDYAEMTPFFTRFYQTRFNEIQSLTQPRPEARPVVEWAFQQGYAVVIATNPMFPRIAVDRRLAWAGIDDFDYDLVTSYEIMHATKPHPSYFQEILDRLDCSPERALMVGDDWERDILPARQVGIDTFWIAPAEARVPDPGVSTLRGTLADFWAGCQAGLLAWE
jgi:HAD superfamily hydrolase (TIGR01549 family)